MRRFFVPILLFLVCSCTEGPQYQTLPPWQEGMLDIHCISTGAGNATYMIMPDATTMLVDAGEYVSEKPFCAPLLPDESKSAGEWIADYIRMFHPQGRECNLDYAFITHYHDDHIGSETKDAQFHTEGGYALSGITRVGSLVPIGKLLDRGFKFPLDLDTCTSAKHLVEGLSFYRKFVDYQCSKGMAHEDIRVGSSDQIRLLNNPQKYGDFNIRILFCSGKVATAEGEGIASEKFAAGEYPGENDLSAGFRLDYGRFKYYSGGDIPGIGHTGSMDPESMECRVADLVGPVDVAVMDHHGDRNSQNEKFVSTLQPRVWLQFGWGVRHPGQETIRRISSKYLYPGERDVYTTWMSPHCEAYLSNALSCYKSLHGHIVVRVAPGGESYDVYVLNDADDRREVLQCNHYETK